MLVIMMVSIVGITIAQSNIQLMEDDKVNHYRGLLPKTNDLVLKSIYEKHLIFYTDDEIPPASQHAGNVLHTSLNISANRSEPFGNPNREFPWSTAAGTHRISEGRFSKFNFIHLPSPLIYWTEQMNAVKARRIPDAKILETIPERNLRWRFPEGAIVGEALMLKGSDTIWYVFDLRTRTKVGGKWRMNAYRPFADFADMCSWLKRHHPSVDVSEFKKRASIKVDRLRSSHPTETVFDRRAAVQILPALPVNVVKACLSKKFVSVREKEWVDTETEEGTLIAGFSPTTNADFHIVPKGYLGAYLRVDSKSCMTCHEGTLREAGDFDFRRDWYGRVRGDDGIISFHPFESSSVSMKYDPYNLQPYRLNSKLLKAGLLKQR